MIPILFSPNITDYSTNGVGRLSDAISCKVHEERNGAFELEMEYPVTGVHFEDIVHSAVIGAVPSARRTLQAFRIYKISKPLNGRVTINAQHISYQLSFIPVSPFSASDLSSALSGFKTNAAEECPFTLSADYGSSSSYAVPLPVSIRSYMGGTNGSILDVYGGEWEFDNYNCILHKSRGQDNGYVIQYGKNLVDLKQEETIANTYTGLYPYWQSEETMVQLPEKVVHASTAANFPFQRTVVHDFSDKFDNAPSAEQLRDISNRYMVAKNIGIPVVSLSLNFVNLADSEEYRDLLTSGNIDLCDIVTVRFEKLGIDEKAKVISIEWDVLKDRYNSIEIGDKRSSLASTIEEQIETVSVMPTIDQMNRSIDRATGVLNSGLRGHMIINRNPEGWANEVLFLDNENIGDAKNVLRINMSGIGFSSTGYQGPYYQSWTLDGHFALGGVNNAYGDFEILSAQGKPLGEWDKDGLKLYDDAENILLEINAGGLYLYDAEKQTLAKMTNEGLGVYAGTIDLKWNGERGLYFGATEGGTDELYIGDFMVSTKYGRQVLQSSDERTGMSGQPTESGGLYLWAGWQSANSYKFVVNDTDAYVQYGGETYPIGESIDALNRAMDVADGENQGADVGAFEGDYAVVGGLTFNDIFG